jgi:drug/metabolite transporter (DMT)-like permease
VFTSWALAFVAIKRALGDGEFTPLAFLWPRMFFSAAFMFAVIPLMREAFRLPRGHFWKVITVGVVGIAGYHLLFTIALKWTTPLDTALIVGTGPVMTALWMPLFKMEKTSLRGWIGIGICLATVAVIALSGASQPVGGATAASTQTTVIGNLKWDVWRVIGDLILVVAANCWALNGILSRRVLPFVSPTTLTAWANVAASAVLLPFCVAALATQNWSGISATGWWCFIYAVLPASTLSIIFYYYGIKSVGPVKTMIYQNTMPVTTAVVAFLWMREAPTWVQIAGMFAIFLGVYLTRTSKEVPHVPVRNP